VANAERARNNADFFMMFSTQKFIDLGGQLGIR